MSPVFLRMPVFQSRARSRIPHRLQFSCLLGLLRSVRAPYSFSAVRDLESSEEHCSGLCRMSLNWVYLMSPGDQTEGMPLGQDCQRWDDAPFSGKRQRSATVMGLLPMDVHPGHWAKVVSARCHHWEVAIFPFVISKYLGESYFETVQVFHFSSSFCSLIFSMNPCSCLQRLLAFFFISLIPSTLRI